MAKHKCNVTFEDGVLDYYCPECYQHVTINTNTGEKKTLFRGDQRIEHYGSVGGLSIGSADVHSDNPFVNWANRFFNSLKSS